MALTPLAVEVLDDTGAPAAGATLEVRDELTSTTATVYARDGSTLTPPDTDADGKAQVWLPNGIYEWRTTGSFVTGWGAFRAYAGAGREALFTETPAAALPTTTTVAVPSGGVDDALGAARVSLTFDHDHMGDVMILLVPPWDATSSLGAVSSGSALSGGSPLVGADVEVRDAVTLASLTLYTDFTGATPLGTPYLTDGSGEFVGYHHAALYQSRVPTSDNLTDWGPVFAATGAAVVLWNGPQNVLIGMSDFALDGSVTFAPNGQDSSLAFADGDTVGVGNLLSDDLSGKLSTGTWTLWIAGGTPGTPGELAAWTLELVPV
jgi:hypothetical protein